MDLDIRYLRYVVEVADAGHFSRAARRLGMSQSALSQGVLKVERHLGFQLFDRHPSGTTPTRAGRAFVADARKAVLAFDETLDRAGRRRRGETGRLTVGFTAAAGLDLIPRILAAFFDLHPGVDVRLVESAFNDRSAGLSDRGSDVAFVRLPLDDAGLCAEVVAEEPLVIALAGDHALSASGSVAVDDIVDEPLVCAPGADEAWTRFWRLEDYRRAPAQVVAYADSCEAEMQIVASGRASVVTSAVAVSHFARAGVAFVPIQDVAPSRVAVAHRAGDANPLVHHFVRLAREVQERFQGVAV